MRATIKMFMMDYARSPLPARRSTLAASLYSISSNRSPPIEKTHPLGVLYGTFDVGHVEAGCGPYLGLRTWSLRQPPPPSLPPSLPLLALSQIVNVKVKNVTHKMLIKVLQIGWQLNPFLVAGGSEHAPKRGVIKILRSTADARQTPQLYTIVQLKRERDSDRVGE